MTEIVTDDSGIVTAGFGTPGKIGHDQPKSAVTFGRNGRSRSAETGGHVRPKYAPAMSFEWKCSLALAMNNIFSNCAASSPEHQPCLRSRWTMMQQRRSTELVANSVTQCASSSIV
jgi:hypothetical protein